MENFEILKDKHTYHIIGLPHTISSPLYNSCAYTQKVVKFGKMMTERGHTVFHYGHEKSDLICTEHISVISEKDFNEIYGTDVWKKESFKYNINDKVYKLFFENAIKEIQKRKSEHHFLLPFWGAGAKPICDAHNDMIVVEPGIGYADGHWARWRVWESYSIYHAFCGLSSVGSCKQDNYNIVIPNYFDINDFKYIPDEKEDYFLFIGRVYDGKGISIAIDATKRAGVKLKVAGPLFADYKSDFPEHVEYLGHVNIETRKNLMAKAKCAIIPSQYVEPFGGVQIECLLSGTPTITSDWGAFTENNIHGLTGYRCRTMGDYVEAIQKIDNIQTKDCRKWGLNFTLDKIAPRYEKFFDDVLDVYKGDGWYSKSNGIDVLNNNLLI